MKLIYLVDDDFDILQSLSKWLVLKKFDVRNFSGSLPLYAALDALLPDLILLDIMLKGEDGRDICREIKHRFQTKIPVILYSSFFGSLTDANADFADGFIDKYAGVHDIIGKLQLHMNSGSR